MSKKIIVLNGSPRKNGNTAVLIKSFADGAKESGNDVTVFNLSEMNIHFCKGCYAGGKNPESPCTQKDDMDKIYTEYQKADIIVLASPLYFWSISGQLKCAFDRLFAVAELDPHYKSPKKDCILLMTAEGKKFDDVIYNYDKLMIHMGWEGMGKMLIGGLKNNGDILNRPELEEAKKLGLFIK